MNKLLITKIINYCLVEQRVVAVIACATFIAARVNTLEVHRVISIFNMTKHVKFDLRKTEFTFPNGSVLKIQVMQGVEDTIGRQQDYTAIDYNIDPRVKELLSQRTKIESFIWSMKS